MNEWMFSLLKSCAMEDRPHREPGQREHTKPQMPTKAMPLGSFTIMPSLYRCWMKAQTGKLSFLSSIPELDNDKPRLERRFLLFPNLELHAHSLKMLYKVSQIASFLAGEKLQQFKLKVFPLQVSPSPKDDCLKLREFCCLRRSW